MLTLEFFRKYLFSKRAGSLVRTISWICMLGTGIGVFSLIVVISVMNGFNDSMKARLIAMEPHLVIQVDAQHPPSFWNTLLKNLRERNASAEFFDSSDAIVRTVDGYVGGAVMRGLERSVLLEMMRKAHDRQTKRNEKWQMPNLEPGDVVMGVDLAISLGIFEDSEVVAIAPEALLLPKGEVPPFERLKVKTIITTGVQDLDNKAIFYVRGESLNQFQRTASHESGIEVRFTDWSEANGVKRSLIEQGVSSVTWAERNSALFFALKLEKLSIGMFLSLSALIASFSIVAVLMLLMTQKRKDLGLLMALGLSPERTRWTFAKLGLVLSFAGIGTGLILGLGVSLFIQKFPLNVLPAIYHDRSIPASVNYWFVLMVLVVASFIALISSWIPARRNTRMSPAEAMRGQLSGSSLSEE